MRVLTHQRIKQALFRRIAGLVLNRFALLVADHADGRFDQIADNLLHIAADIANFSELGRFNFQKRRIGELGEAPRDLGFPDAGWPDHQDVFWRDLFAQALRGLFTPPAIAQRQGNGAFRFALANNMAIKLRNNLGRGQYSHSKVLSRFRREQAIPDAACWKQFERQLARR